MGLPKQQSQQKPDVEAIMRRIRDEVKRSLAENPSKSPTFNPLEASSNDNGTEAVIYSEELNYLNANWNNWSSAEEISSHRKFVGPIIVKVKRFFVELVWNYCLKGYFERERQFQMHLVRFLNDTAKYIEKRDAEIFWQIIRKVDNDVAALNERVDRIYDEASGTSRQIEHDLSQRVGDIEVDRNLLIDSAQRQKQDYKQLDEMIRGLERTISLLGKRDVVPRAAANGASSEQISSSSGKAEDIYGGAEGVDYLLLENRYRGSEELIRERQRDYLPLFNDVQGPVIELGCGRGEFLELLRDAGIEAFGIDISDAMIACCVQKELRVAQSDAIAYLEQLEDHSIGGIFAAQVVEHLTRDELDQLLTLAVRKVVPGGVVAFETINPGSVCALSSNFFRDPTHVWPLHPDTMRFMLEMHGIATADVMLRSPYPEGATLQKIPIQEHLPARWTATLNSINQNMERLNSILFGYQDYCIVGRIDPVAVKMQEGKTSPDSNHKDMSR